MIPSIALVGAGPTAIYAVNALVRSAKGPFSLTIFEEQEVAGRGTPYRPGWNDPAMLSNIASIEIPRIGRSLVEWLRAQSAEHLAEVGVEGEIDERAFYPRLALGAFLHEEFQALIDRARAAGITIDLRTRSRVVDALPDKGGFSLIVETKGGPSDGGRFDYLVIATGHQWPDDPQVRTGYYLSPWPATVLDGISACAVGIRGASLTAIDAAVVLAQRFGTFEDDGDRLMYQPDPQAEAFSLTLMSRKGLLPEADFFHPIPYESLATLTPERIEQELEIGPNLLLDRIFELLKEELRDADPDYASHIGLEQLDLEGFRDGYFADRLAADTFDWARSNLAEAERNCTTETTVPWRYAILRAHEIVAPVVPYLDEEDFRRFNRSLKPVFVDDYATVPHESIKRMLALRDAGKLDVIALGEKYEIDGQDGTSGATVSLGGQKIHFPAFIEATGQKPLGIDEFPFPTLREVGLVEDAAHGNMQSAARGVAVDDHFHPLSQGESVERLFCVSLPFILGRHPFVQGITSSHELGEIVGTELAEALARHGEEHRRIDQDIAS